jgi:hypothetical protein
LHLYEDYITFKNNGGSNASMELAVSEKDKMLKKEISCQILNTYHENFSLEDEVIGNLRKLELSHSDTLSPEVRRAGSPSQSYLYDEDFERECNVSLLSNVAPEAFPDEETLEMMDLLEEEEDEALLSESLLEEEKDEPLLLESDDSEGLKAVPKELTAKDLLKIAMGVDSR